VDQNYILRVKQPVGTVVALVRMLCGDDTTLSLTGSLTQLDWRWLEPDTYTVVEYSEYTHGVTIKLTSHNCEALAERVLPRVGLAHNVHEVTIKKGENLSFAAYDNFYPQLVSTGFGVDGSTLRRLVSDNLLQCYYPAPRIEESIREWRGLWALCFDVCAELKQVEQIEQTTRGYVVSKGRGSGGTRVVGLGLHGVAIKQVPQTIANFEHLITLSLTGNGLRKLGKYISRCERLERLYASYNSLTSVPAGLKKLKKLKTLDLSNNQISSLPEEFGSLTTVEVLNLSVNMLEQLPANFSNLASLKFLDIRDNPLTDSSKKVLGLMTRRGCRIVI
jgi:hypothetical protein